MSETRRSTRSEVAKVAATLFGYPSTSQVIGESQAGNARVNWSRRDVVKRSLKDAFVR